MAHLYKSTILVVTPRCSKCVRDVWSTQKPIIIILIRNMLRSTHIFGSTGEHTCWRVCPYNALCNVRVHLFAAIRVRVSVYVCVCVWCTLPMRHEFVMIFSTHYWSIHTRVCDFLTVGDDLVTATIRSIAAGNL